MKALVVAAAFAALGLAGCQSGMSYADAQASCEAQGYKIGTKRFDRCVTDMYRTPTTTVAVGVVDEPVYVAPGPVVVEGYYGGPGPGYYRRPYYGGPYYGRPYYGSGYYWR